MIKFNPLINSVRPIKNFGNANTKKVNFKANDTFEKSYYCVSYLCDDDTNVIKENFPPDYTYQKTKEYNFSYLKPHYVILHLESYKKGGGTAAIKSVVKKSFENPFTEGRVLLFSSALDRDNYSAGFYYKLGFRFNYEGNNKIMNKWLKSGGKRENAPSLEGPMYLPKENIAHCLNY